MDKSDKDRIEGIGDEVSGKAKETVGNVTDNEQMEGEGKADQVKGDVKQGIADLKDKASDAMDRFKKDN